MSTLATLGGQRVRERPWPKWPRADANTEQNLLDVLRSGRWAISGMFNGEKLYERRFADAFATYHNIPYCVPATNGSSALTMALEAVGVQYGDEVLVPGMTWVACASSVVRVGAIPILVDVEPDTLCMSIDAARRAIAPRTRAIMLVHLYCAVADLDAFVALSEETGIPLIEDCSQAHGAMWRNRRVGTFGLTGVFSMQDTKVLTCGEGGAVITKDPQIYDLLQQLRADGRRYPVTPVSFGQPELEEVGAILGRNMCLSEFHAAVLLDRLQHLDEENRLREQNANYLRSLLNQIGGVQTLRQAPQVDALTYYQFCVRLDLNAFGRLDIETIRRALVAELGVFVEQVDSPLNSNVLYNPLRSPRINKHDNMAARLDPGNFDLPVATRARYECLTMPHKVLLGDKRDVEDIALAFSKVKQHCEELLELQQTV